MTIRGYEPKDFDDVRFVCLNSEGPCDLDEDGRFFILTTYCDYYIEREPENCFVAADENDRAVGYIICAKDYDAYHRVFESEYLPRLSSLSAKHRFDAKNSTIMQKKYKADYPAHMHIDLLPEYQRMGLGSRMVDTLRDHLRSQNVPGVMLTVGSGNKVGQSFYNKYGFTLLKKFLTEYAYGIRT